MKKYILITALFVLSGLCLSAQTTDSVEIETDENVSLEMIAPAQPVKESKEEIKAREKALREFNDDVAYSKAVASLSRGYFVLVADNIQIGNTGYRRYDLNQNSNFVLVQGNDGIIQFAYNTGRPGSNGLGGWTGKGSVQNKRIKYLDNGDVFFEYQLVGSTVNASVSVTLYHGGKRAVAEIMGDTRITFYGENLPYRDKKHR